MKKRKHIKQSEYAGLYNSIQVLAKAGLTNTAIAEVLKKSGVTIGKIKKHPTYEEYKEALKKEYMKYSKKSEKVSTPTEKESIPLTIELLQSIDNKLGLIVEKL